MEPSRNSRRGIRKVSRSRAKETSLYQSRKRVFLRKNPKCGLCKKQAKDIHHAFGRTGKLLLWSAFWVPLCRNCHDSVGRDPNFARERFWEPRNGMIPIPSLAPKGYWLRPWAWVQGWIQYWDPNRPKGIEQCERCGWIKHGECTRCNYV